MERQFISNRPVRVCWLRNGLEKDISTPRKYDPSQDMVILVFDFPYPAHIAVGIGPYNVRLSELFKQGKSEEEAIWVLSKSFLGGFIHEPHELGKRSKKKYSLFKAEATFESAEEYAYKQAANELKASDGKFDTMKVAERKNQIIETLPEFVAIKVKLIPVDSPQPRVQFGNIEGLFKAS